MSILWYINYTLVKLLKRYLACKQKFEAHQHLDDSSYKRRDDTGKSAAKGNRRNCFLQIPVEQQYLDDAAKKENVATDVE